MSRLEKLTEKQTAAMPFYKDKWLNIATSSAAPEFYDDFIINKIKNAIIACYKKAKYAIKEENIILSTSPIMSMFVASAKHYGKVGNPIKPIKWNDKKNKNIVGMKVVENFLNTYSNPHEIVNKSAKYKNSIYWGMSDAGYCGFLDFFRNETDIKVDWENADFMNVLTEFTHFVIFEKDFCVVSMRPSVLRTNKGTAIKDGKPYILWSDGIGLQ